MKPLTGMRVIEFASVVSGPYSGLMLADLGAEVIKVEAPVGDITRKLLPAKNGMSAGFYNLNRNKRSVVLNLKFKEGIEIATQLVGTADVALENWRPDVANRLGLGARHLRNLYPRLVTATVRGYGEKGPLAHERAYDTTVQALSGLAANATESQEPVLLKSFIADKLAGVALTQGILAALVQRANSGVGSHVEANMLETAIAFQWPDTMREMTFTSSSQQSMEQRTGLLCMSADARWLALVAVSNAEWISLCSLIQRPELAESHKTVAHRKRDAKMLHSIIADFVGERTLEENLELLRSAGVPCSPVNQVADLATDPQVDALGSIKSVNRPGLGAVLEPPPLVRTTIEDGEPGLGAPTLGEHTVDVLFELGFSRTEIRRLESTGAIVTSQPKRPT